MGKLRGGQSTRSRSTEQRWAVIPVCAWSPEHRWAVIPSARGHRSAAGRSFRLLAVDGAPRGGHSVCSLPKSLLEPAERPQSQFFFAYGPRPAVSDPESDRPIENDVGRHRRATRWHQLQAFNIDPHHPQSRYRELYAVRIACKGDLVRVAGRPATWTVPDGHTFHYLEIVSFRIVALKRRPA